MAERRPFTHCKVEDGLECPQVLKRPISWRRRGSAAPIVPAAATVLPLRSLITLHRSGQNALSLDSRTNLTWPPSIFLRLSVRSSGIRRRYRHLMQNVVLLLRHAKDSKVESKESKDSALNELVELRSCSSFLFFDVLQINLTGSS